MPRQYRQRVQIEEDDDENGAAVEQQSQETADQSQRQQRSTQQSRRKSSQRTEQQPPAKKQRSKRAATNDDVDLDEEDAEIDGIVNGEKDARVRERKIDDMIRYFLMASQTQKSIQRGDVAKSCLGKEHGNDFAELFEVVKTRMRHIFGIDILHSEEKRGFYYLSNSLQHTDFLKVGKDQAAKDALLFAILSNIFMQNPVDKEINEGAFKSFLEKINIHLDERPIVKRRASGNQAAAAAAAAAVFDDAKDLITKKFVEHGWLTIRRDAMDAHGNNEMFYGWGWRSKLVLNRGDIITFVTEIAFRDGSQGRMYQDQLAVAEEEDKQFARDLD